MLTVHVNSVQDVMSDIIRSCCSIGTLAMFKHFMKPIFDMILIRNINSYVTKKMCSIAPIKSSLRKV